MSTTMPAEAATAVTTSAGDAATKEAPPKRWLIGLALASVYLIWGSTYLGMRIALEVWPPLLMGGVRYTLAGMLLFVVLLARGERLPDARAWGSALIVGFLLLTMGNGLVGYAQSHGIDSGIAATVVATMPMWMALLALGFGERPTAREVFGLALGFAGVAILRGGGSLSAGWVATLAIVAAPVAWSFGSLLARRLPMPKGLMAAAMQMIAGGVVMLLVGSVGGEEFPVPNARTSLAIGYLVVFGSLLGFTAYGFLLRSTRTAVASSYAYVNPVVALILGSVLAGEAITLTKVLASAIIIAGVIVVTARRRPVVK